MYDLIWVTLEKKAGLSEFYIGRNLYSYTIEITREENLSFFTHNSVVMSSFQIHTAFCTMSSSSRQVGTDADL